MLARQTGDSVGAGTILAVTGGARRDLCIFIATMINIPTNCRKLLVTNGMRQNRLAAEITRQRINLSIR